jgi:hypothetical protein
MGAEAVATVLGWPPPLLPLPARVPVRAPRMAPAVAGALAVKVTTASGGTTAWSR